MPVYNFGHYLVPQSGSQPPAPFPQGLRTSGPVVPVLIEIPSALADRLQQSGQTIPSPASGLALVDTGASVSAVDAGCIQQLGVQPVGIVTVGTAAGPQQQMLYPGRFSFPGTNLPSIDFSSLLGADLAAQGVDGPRGGPLVALLGRDLLEHFVLVYNGLQGLSTLAY
jgi:hypothetical protein